MDEVRCLVGQAEILVAQLEVSVLLVDIYGMAKKYGRLKVFYWRLCLKGILVFQVPLYCRYLVEHDTR